MAIVAVGVDLAKNVFAVHGVDETGKVVLLKPKVKRADLLPLLRSLPACLIGMEACSGAHHWARELIKAGHDARLMAAKLVAPYRDGGKNKKNDAADAAAICEAVQRKTMRFVPIKTEEQQSVLVLHRSRDLLMRQRTMMLNAIRAHLAEFGTITAQGPSKVVELVAKLGSEETFAVPEIARVGLLALAAQLDSLATAIRDIERQLLAWHRQNAASQRLETIPGVGIITATALAASVPDPSVFKSGRQFAAFLGLVPRQNSSGGKDRLGHISKMGNGYLRRLLVVGATSVTRRAETNDTRTGAWVRSLLGRKPTRLVTVAIANKTARTAWAMLARNEDYRASAMA